ncbi:MAG TPA: glutamine amidotransferase [Planctomycetota bacterium]|nr:glutamine amidotransferase [Planctomycetota bacterium]
MHWSFEYPWSPALTWLIVVGVLMVLTGSLALVWRELFPLSVASAAIIALRLGSLALLVYLLLQPSVVFTKSEEVKPHVALLLDTSGSMSVVDTGRDRPRLREALEALRASALVEKLAEKAKLDLFEFATGLSRLKPEALDTLEKAGGTGTSLGLAISQVRDELKGEDIAGVVLFSDGRDNTGSDPLAAAKELEAPVYTVGFGRPKPKEVKEKESDLSIVNVSHDKRIVVGHTSDVTVTVGMKGFGARSVQVELVLDGAVITQSAVALSPDRPERQVSMKLKPTSPGQFVYSVRVPADPAEGNKSNNEKPMPVFVADPVSRVLYVEARPRWEFKFLSRVLAAYKNVEHTAVIRMAPGKMMIQGTNPAESARIATMTPAELQRLKAIIVGDVPHTFFTPEQLDVIAALVEQGGAVLLMGGKASFGTEGFAGTPLARVLPVQLQRLPSYMEKRFQVELTPEGRAHPAFQGVQQSWAKAPELISLMAVGEVRPGATVLMKTTDGSDLPVVVAHRYGKGKAIVVLTDCTWRWKLGMAEGQMQEDLQTLFWRQLVTWLMPEEQAEKERRAVQLVADRLSYELNQPVNLTITAVDADGKAVANAKVVCHVHAPDGKVIERMATRVGGGSVPREGKGEKTRDTEVPPTMPEGYTASFVPHVGGKYKVVATAQAGGADLGRDQLSLIVGDTSIEMNETDPNRDLLKKLATSSAGRYYEPVEAERIAADITINAKKHTWTEKREVWDKWWVFLTFLALMSAEWVLRRRRQLE